MGTLAGRPLPSGRRNRLHRNRDRPFRPKCRPCKRKPCVWIASKVSFVTSPYSFKSVSTNICNVVCTSDEMACLDDGSTIEIRRVCTDGTRNACSILYGACARIAREMGYKPLTIIASHRPFVTIRGLVVPVILRYIGVGSFERDRGSPGLYERGF